MNEDFKSCLKALNAAYTSILMLATWGCETEKDLVKPYKNLMNPFTEIFPNWKEYSEYLPNLMQAENTIKKYE